MPKNPGKPAHIVRLVDRDAPRAMPKNPGEAGQYYHRAAEQSIHH
jgi:hypothetical protein